MVVTCALIRYGDWGMYPGASIGSISNAYKKPLGSDMCSTQKQRLPLAHTLHLQSSGQFLSNSFTIGTCRGTTRLEGSRHFRLRSRSPSSVLKSFAHDRIRKSMKGCRIKVSSTLNSPSSTQPRVGRGGPPP